MHTVVSGSQWKIVPVMTAPSLPRIAVDRQFMMEHPEAGCGVKPDPPQGRLHLQDKGGAVITGTIFH
jgi:hypothetical protein